MGANNSTGSIGINGGVLKASALGIGQGFLTSDTSRNLSTEVSVRFDMPLSANLVAVWKFFFQDELFIST